MLFTLLLACTGPKGDSGDAADTADTAPAGPGTLVFTFQMEEDLIPSMDNPPVGTFGGSIFAEADATAIGPNEGAVSLEDFSCDIDLSDGGGPSSATYTTGSLDSGVVWVLGCLDTDGDGCGDEGDPITVPNENKVIVVADAETPFTVLMSMLRP